jgi:hypothetical protein
MRTVLFVVLVACSGNDPHDVIDCGQSWSTVLGTGSATCERACVPPPAMLGSGCGSAIDSTTGAVGRCTATFLSQGKPSCCGLENTMPRTVDIVLVTCE